MEKPNRSSSSDSASTKAPATVLIKNVSIFNGTSEQLIAGKDVVLVGNKIDKFVPAGSGGKYDKVIDGLGGYLSPGLIDMHWHMSLGVGFEESPFPVERAKLGIMHFG